MRSITTILLVCICSTGNAQYFEVGLFGGASNYQGDLAPFAFTPKETHLAYGYFTKFNFNKYASLKISGYYGEISGDDKNSKNEWRLRRNLSFRSEIWELSTFAEINLTGFDPHSRKKLLSPYAFIGFGVFHFNPQAFYEGQWYDLQPLGTEGQGTSAYPDRDKYKLMSFSFPMGLGFKGSITEHWNVALEMGWRKTFTDYLDDVSSTYIAKEILIAENGELSWELSNRMDETIYGEGFEPDDSKYRGDPDDLDWYIFSGITVSYNFDLLRWDLQKNTYKEDGNGKTNGLKSSRKKMGCPKNLR
ncbi:MAG: DUF6089 family protein [Chitinophagales bacterium]